MATSKYYYMTVTTDKYELPIIVAESARELAEKLGIKESTVYSTIDLDRSGKIKTQKIIRVLKI